MSGRPLGITGRMVVAGALVAITVTVTFGFLFDAIGDLRASARDAQRSQELLSTANRLQTLVVQLQSGQRGYLLTGDQTFLASLERAVEQLDDTALSLERLAAGEPGRERLTARVIRAVRAYHEGWVVPVLALADRDLEAARAKVATGEGDRRMTRIGALFAALAVGDRAQARASLADAEGNGRRAVLLGVVAAAAIMLLLAAIISYFSRGIVTPVKRLATAAREASAGDLGARAASGGIGEAASLTVAFNELADVREQRTEEAARRSAELEAVLDAAAEGICMTDLDGTLILTNMRMNTLWQEFGVAEKGSIWERVGGLAVLTGDAERYAAEFARIAGDIEAVFEDDFDLPALERTFRGYTGPVRGPEGQVIGRIFSLRETTDERAAERAKEDFIATVSHELRTPLTSIRGYLEAVFDEEVGALNDEQRRFLEVVDRNANRLERLVGDLLLVGQIESGELFLDRTEVDLAAIAAQAVEAARPVAAAKGVVLTSEIPDALHIHGDPTRLAQVLDNLISNAVKFTPSDGRADVVLGDADDAVTIEVADTGMGIAEDDREHLFKRFFRTRQANERAVPGTGLGLAIVKAIVDAHGGKIDVESVSGAGTTFRVRLPRAPQEPQR